MNGRPCPSCSISHHPMSSHLLSQAAFSLWPCVPLTQLERNKEGVHPLTPPWPLFSHPRGRLRGLKSELRISCVIPRPVWAISFLSQERGRGWEPGLLLWACSALLICETLDKLPLFLAPLLEIPQTSHDCHMCVNCAVGLWCAGHSGKEGLDLTPVLTL